MSQYLSEQQTAHLLGVSKKTIQRLRKNGRIPYYSIGRLVRINSNDVESFLRSTQVNIAQSTIQIKLK